MIDFESLQIGKLIRDVRKRRGLSIEAAAVKLQLLGCDVSFSMLQKYESETARQRARELVALSVIYETDLARLITEQITA